MGASVDITAADFGTGAEAGSDKPQSNNPTTDNAQSPSPYAGMGPLLQEPDSAKVVSTLVQWIREQGPARKRRRAEWECNKLWLRGVRGARVRRQSEDRNDVELVVPLGAYDLPPVMDRVDELLEKTVSHLLSDPPAPEAEPASDSSIDRDSAEFTTRLLTIEGSESGFNNLKLMRRAARKAGVFGSSFIYACIDPSGNGWRPTEIRALPMAQTTQDATVDPLTQQPVADGDPRLTKRYVRQDESLTDDPAEARPQWLPKLRPELLTGEHVIMLPETCTGIDDATGAIIIRYTPLARLRNEFQELQSASDETIAKLANWSPDDAKYARPGFQKSTDIKGTTTDGKVSDSAMICTLSLYFRSHSAYPKGAYIVAGGDDIVLHKQPWSGMVETEPGKVQEECLMLPLAQERHLDDDVDDDPYGKGLIAKIGPADEVRGQIVLGWLEHLDRFLHPVPMLPLGSICQPGDITRRDDTPIFFNPAGKPEWEAEQPFLPDAIEFFDRATDAQNSATGLEQTAQGVEAASVTSGVQAQEIIQQSHVNLATLRANLGDCQERWWRICTQLFRVFYTIPQKLKYQGDDGAYKEREWTRVDLGSTKDVRIARGTFTQQSQDQKQSTLDARYAAKLIDGEEYDRLSATNVRATLGYQDNPHRMRIRSQLNAWKDGPPADFQQKEAAQQQATAQWQSVAAQAQQTGQQPPPQPPDTNTPFTSVPVDQEQDVARIRWLEMRREMSSSSFAQQPPAWQQKFIVAYEAARKAAGIQTVAEQQQAAAMQAQQQQQQAQQANALKMQTHAMTLNHEAAQSESERAFAAEQSDAANRAKSEQQALHGAGDNVPPAKRPPIRLVPTPA